MKYRYVLLCLGAASLALCSCTRGAGETGSGEVHDAGAHEGHEDHAHASGEIIVEPSVASRFGLRVDTVAAGDFTVALRASGTASNSGEADGVVSSPTAGIVRFVSGINPGSDVRRGTVVATVDASGMSGGDANAAARAALENARTEYERIEALYKEQMATVGERNAALAAYRAAQAAYSPAASSGEVKSPVAGTITSLAVREGQYVEPGEVVATVAADGNLTLRIDIPQKFYSSAPSFTDAVLEFSYLPGTVTVAELGGKRLGTSPAPSGAASAYLPVYFTVPRGSGIIPGSSFRAYLLGAPRHGVITLPVSALSEQQGQYFVYEQIDDEGFVKIPVTLGESDGRRVEILSGISEGMRIVTDGVTTVRLAENGANIPEGHSHNH